MALLYCDSFDYYGNHNVEIEQAMLSNGWLDVVGARQQVNLQNNLLPRTGRGSVVFAGGSNRLRWYTPTIQDTLIFSFGFAVAEESPRVETIAKFEYNDAATHTVQVYVERNLANGINARRGDGTLLGSSAAGVHTLNNWHFWQFKIKAHNTSGIVEVKIDNAVVLSLSGIDTNNGTPVNELNQINFDRAGTTIGCHIDDFVVMDTTGSKNNDFLGAEARVYYLRPNGVGAAAQWAANGAATNWESVDEIVEDGDTTYTSESVSGQKDLHECEDLPSAITHVYGVQVHVHARLEEGGSDQLKIKNERAGSEQESAALALTSTYGFEHQMFENEPAGGNWSPGAVNDMNIGYEHV